MIVRNMMTKETYVVEYDLDSPRERGWPADCRKCSLYDKEKGCTGRSVDRKKPMCHCMSRKRYDYLSREE